jgi:hypothetical protein
MLLYVLYSPPQKFSFHSCHLRRRRVEEVEEHFGRLLLLYVEEHFGAVDSTAPLRPLLSSSTARGSVTPPPTLPPRCPPPVPLDKALR